MIELTLAEIVEAVGGKLTLVGATPASSVDGRSTLADDAGVAPTNSNVRAVSTDSRNVPAGALFFALKGDKFDGHDFVPKLTHAAAAVVSESVAGATVPQIVVDDTRHALGRLGSFVRRRLAKTRVVAIAGSNGKTGTKALVHAALSSRLIGTASPKSFNNDIGVPLTLFGAAERDDYVVLEIGTNHPGEVAHLSMMSEPDVAVITSIGEEHMEFFKTLDGVRQENAAIVDGLRPGGTVVCVNDAALVKLVRAKLTDHKVVTFGADVRATHASSASVAPTDDADLLATNVHVGLSGTTFALGGKPFFVPMIGRHVASNATAAIAVARHLGLSDDEIRLGLATATGPEMRLEKIVAGRVVVLNDAYNANPTSVRAAIQTLRDLDWPGRTVAVLGEMKELGDLSPAAHRDMARLAIDALSRENVTLVGEAYRGLSDHWFATAADAAAAVPQSLRDGDLVLVKASRSVKLEIVARAVAERFGPSPAS